MAPVPAYRLQTLLEMRQRAEDEAKQNFAAAMRKVAEAKQEQTRLEEELARRKAERVLKVKAYLADLMAKGKGALAVQGMGVYEKRLRGEEDETSAQIDKQKEVVREAESEAERKRLDLAEAAKELKAIEKHKEKWQKEVKAQRDAREQIAGEEIGNALFLARKRKEG